MLEDAHQSLKETSYAGITHFSNSSPSKVQPWMQATGGVPVGAKMCSGSTDSTHGIPEGSLLIMGNRPIGIDEKSESLKGGKEGLLEPDM